MVATCKVIRATGTTAATATLTAGIEPNELIVIDWIKAWIVGGTGQAILRAGDELLAIELARQPVNADGSTFDFDFSAGYPCWENSNDDGTVSTSIVVSVLTSGGTPTDAEVVVGYHAERPSHRRAFQ